MFEKLLHLSLIENIVELKKILLTSIFFFFPQCFQKSSGPQPITRQQILHSSKLKGFADDNFKSDKNGRKLILPVENTVVKGEIDRYEQFLFFSQCFQKACFRRGIKRCHCAGMVNSLPHKIPTFNNCNVKSLLKTLWKRRKYW